MILIYTCVFFVSFAVLIFSSWILIKSLSRVAKFLGWKEFVVAFFTMALAGSLPNLSVGISSVLHNIPKLSFSEIVGGNIIHLTMAIALAALISKNGLSLSSRVVQGSAVFTLGAAILPLVLVFDGKLSRTDGLLLILVFVIYIGWLFSKKERFSKEYNNIKSRIKVKTFFINLLIILGAVLMLFLAAEGIVRSATFFSNILNLPIVLIGIFVVGLGNAMPEICFAVQAARKGQDWMVVGNLMGAVIFPVTLVLGLVALISPIEISDFSPFVIARIFLIISAVFFLLFLRTGKKISKKEAFFLLSVYLLFVLAEVLFSI